MSHRIYLYTCSRIGKSDGLGLSLIEWGYALPLTFHAGFGGDCRIGRPLLNGTQGGLYVPAAAAVAGMERLYAFLDRHRERLIADTDAYETARDKVLRRLAACTPYKWLHLDAWDVFNLDETAHTQQAGLLLDELRGNARLIELAIATDDPSVLDRLHGLNGESLRDYLADTEMDYGWRPLEFYSELEEADAAEIRIVEEDGRFGLKNGRGDVIAEAVYDELYEVNRRDGRRVARRDGLYGYLDREGRTVLPFVYRDAFDFDVLGPSDVRRAVVLDADGYGLIDADGHRIGSGRYRSLWKLDGQDAYCAQTGEGWGVIDADGGWLLAPTLHAEPEEERSAGTLVCPAIAGQPGRRFTDGWQEIGLFTEEVERVWQDGSAWYVLRQGRGRAAVHALADAAGRVVLPLEYTRIEHDDALGGFVCTLGRKTGLFDPAEGWLLPCEFDAVSGHGTPPHHYAVLRRGRRYGVYAPGRREWVLPERPDRIDILTKNLIRVQTKQGVQLHRLADGAPVGALFEEATDLGGWLDFAAALAFSEGTAYAVAQDGSMKPVTAAQAGSVGLDALATLQPKHRQLLLDRLPPKRRRETLYESGRRAACAGDWTQAAQAYRAAAGLDHAGACRELGRIHERVDGLMDEHEARRWYARAAALGDSDGHNDYGRCLLHGLGGEVDIAGAVQQFERSVALGNQAAAANLGLLYYAGTEVDADPEAAKRLLLQAWERFPYPMQLAWLFAEDEDWVRARYYYEAAAQQGDAHAWFMLGYSSLVGYGTAPDREQALACYRRAAAAGHADAEAELRAMEGGG